MARLPKVLVALFMVFALILQASASSACAIGCLLGVCASKQVATVHHDHEKDHGGNCCDHEKDESSDHDHGGLAQFGSEHKDSCGCPTMASCAVVVPKQKQEARVQTPNVDLPVNLPATLALTFSIVEVPEPGYFSNDSSPPVLGQYAPDHGPAPPGV